MMFLLLVLALPVITIAQVGDTTMTLYSRTKPAGAEIACNSAGHMTIVGRGWRKAELKLITHGFKSDGEKEEFREIRDAWLRKSSSRRPIKVIVLNWKSLAFPKSNIIRSYDRAAFNALAVGGYVGKCLASLVSQTRMDPMNIHLVGHSLGAHLVGEAGRVFARSARPKKIGMVTGLDPAGPHWVGPSAVEGLKEKILSISSGVVVEVIHTNGGKQSRGIAREFIGGIARARGLIGELVLPLDGNLRFGAKQNLGTVDYFPGGGESQDNCACHTTNLLRSKCSHSRATEYFLLSIRRTRPCDTKDCWDQLPGLAAKEFPCKPLLACKKPKVCEDDDN